MRSLKLVSLAVVLALGAGVTGYALAARPAAPVVSPSVEPSTECAVPAPVAGPAAVVAPSVEPVVVPVTRETRETHPSDPTPSGHGLRARRITVTHAIEDREPVDELDVVEARQEGDRLYAFVDLANAGEATEVDVTFRHESGLTVGHVALEIPAHVSRHRTWAYSSRIEEPGNWTAIGRDGEGRTLAVHNFEVR